MVLPKPFRANDSAVGPVDLHDVGEAQRTIRKLGTAAQKNLAVEHRLARLCADESDGHAVARRAVRLNTAAITLTARIAAVVFAAGFAVSDVRMAGLSGRCLLLWRRSGLSRLGCARRRAGRLIGWALAVLIVPPVFGQLGFCNPVPAQLPSLEVPAALGLRIAAIAFVVQHRHRIDLAFLIRKAKKEKWVSLLVVFPRNLRKFLRDA